MANPNTEVIGGEEENFAAMLEESFKGKGSTKGGELKENLLKLVVILVLRHGGFFLAQARDLKLESIALS